MIERYFSTVKILAQRPTHISLVATALLITKTFTVKYYNRRQHQYKYSINNNNNNKRQRQRETERDRQRERQTDRQTETERVIKCTPR